MMTTTLPNAVGNSVLDRVLAPDHSPMAPEIAREILKWGFSDSDREEMSSLAAKARTGTLTQAEQLAIAEYEMAANLLGVVKIKARRALRQEASA